MGMDAIAEIIGAKPRASGPPRVLEAVLRRPRARRDATQSPVSDLLQARTQEQHSAPALSLYLTHFRTAT